MEGTAFTVQYPELAAQWHPTKNGDLRPEDLTPGSNRRVFWQCDRGHVWQASIKTRTRGAGCPYCMNRRLLRGQNDLETVCPTIAAQWHPTKNGDLRPSDVIATTQRKVYWKCEQGHEWKAMVSARIRAQTGCPVCAGKRVEPGFNDLASWNAELAAQWDDSRNGRLTPADVSPYSNRTVWWRCEKGHAYRAVVSDRTTRHSGCPYCAGRRVLTGFNDLRTVDPELAMQWHPTLNAALTPEMVTAGSRKKVWWICGDGHIWKAAIYSRTGSQKCGCPVCAGTATRKYMERYMTAPSIQI